MAQAMVLGGLRRSEVLGLRFDDLRLADRRVFIVDGKGGRQRLIPISERFFVSVSSYLAVERPTDASHPSGGVDCRGDGNVDVGKVGPLVGRSKLASHVRFLESGRSCVQQLGDPSRRQRLDDDEVGVGGEHATTDPEGGVDLHHANHQLHTTNRGRS